MTEEHKYEMKSREQPTFYFIGVTTGESSINDVFPLWMEEMNRPDVVLEGVDHKIHDDPEAYRRTVAQIKYDERSLGGLVTTHKIDLLDASNDMFDELDSYAKLTGEVSCISKENGELHGYAMDPISAGLSLHHIIGDYYFGRTGAHVFLLGAGGSATATILYLINRDEKKDRPQRIIAVDKDPSRLDELNEMVESLDTEIECTFVENEDPERNDEIMGELPEGSIVINATGMGKDLPGSPITDDGVFPKHGVAWEFNYRGERKFLQQARRQEAERDLTVEDGWVYFLHGWSQVIGEVLDIEITDELFERLNRAASSTR